MNPHTLQLLLRSYGIHTKERNHNLMACCPFHQEMRPSWGISTVAPHLHGCFSCGAKGDLVSLVAAQHRISYLAAEKLLEPYGILARASQEGAFSFKLTPFRDLVPLDKIPDLEQELFMALRPMNWLGSQYLRRRGILAATIKALGLGYCKESRRVLFPWIAFDKFFGATGRTIENNLAKTIPFADLNKGQLLYMPLKKLLPSCPAVIVEGELDAIALYQRGIQNVAATGFGLFTNAQRDLVLNYGVKDVIAFGDNDLAGKKFNRVLHHQLGKRLAFREVRYPSDAPEGADPASLPSSQCLSLVANSVKVLFTRTKISLV